MMRPPVVPTLRTSPRLDKRTSLPMSALPTSTPALPQLDKPATVQRSCEVIVLETGTRCVANPKTGSKAVAKNAPAAKRAKQ